MSEFSRVLGQRQRPLLGALRAPSADERAWVARMAPARTRVPKGVFRYRSMRDANADWERWQADAITAEPRPATSRASERPKDQAEAALLREALARLARQTATDPE